MDNNFEKILSRFGICKPLEITRIYRSAWHIGDDFVLKTNGNDFRNSVGCNNAFIAVFTEIMAVF